MSTEKKPETKSDKETKDDEMDRLARQMLLDEAKRSEIRAETQGALGWKKPTLVTNRKFLCNTLISNALHNIHRNERERQQRQESNTSKRTTDSDDQRTSAKRSKKDR